MYTKTNFLTGPMVLRTSVALALVIASANIGSFGQCANNNTVLAGGAISPTCPGQTTISCITGGEYALVNVTNGRNYTFSTCGAPFDTQITIYNNAGGGSLGYNDDSGYCGGVTSYLAWTATFTGQLRVLVDRYNCTSNTLCATLVITCATTPAAVTHNACSGAIPLLVIDGCFMQTYSNVGASRSGESPTPSCGGTWNNTNSRDVWFSFTAPSNGVVIIQSVPGTLQDGVMQLVAGTCASFSNVECDDNDGVGSMPRIDRRCLTLTPNAPYMIRYWGRSGATGTFGLCVGSISSFATPQEDCSGGATVCGDQQLNNSTDYTGCTTDLSAGNRGCLMGNERQGTWYYFSPSLSGTIGLTIAPTGNVDYDFAIWGPYTTLACPPASPPLRCSWAYPPNVAGYPANASFETGMRAASVDPSEADGPSPAVDGFTSEIPVIAGEKYVMFIDNFDITGQAFTLNWNLSGGASLDCSLLPVELVDMQATAVDGQVLVEWTTVTERASASYIVERAIDPEFFTPIGEMVAAGESRERIDYDLVDRTPHAGLNYYRVKQVDLDGSFEYSPVVTAMIVHSENAIRVVPNPASDRMQIIASKPVTGMVVVEVLDLTGRSAQKRTMNILEDGPLMMEIGGLVDGTYLLLLSLPDGSALGTARFQKS